MDSLQPNWNQQKPSPQDALLVGSQVSLQPFQLESEAIGRVLERLRVNHSNGGAFIASVRVGSNEVFDWFASRNRLLEYDILPLLLRRDEIRSLLPSVAIPETLASNCEGQARSVASSGGFSFDNPFLLDGQLAQRLFAGGAYPPESKMSGRAAMQLAAEFCEAVFGRRYEDVCLFSSYEPWTPWFRGIAWDWTSILFDKGERSLWILVVTDED
jgi:hypothetical protein